MELHHRFKDFERRYLRDVRYLLVTDLEATCCDKNTIPRDQMETIEIGIEVLDRDKNWDAVYMFQSFIKPVLNPVLTDFCKELTHISQEQVDVAFDYLSNYEYIQKMLQELGGRWAWCSWGAYDKKQLILDGEHHSMPPLLPPDNHFNLKVHFSSLTGRKKQLGLSRALDALSMTFEGVPHRAYTDAKNTARIFQWLMRDHRNGVLSME